MSEGTTYGVASVLSIPTIANALAHAIIRPLTRAGFGFYLCVRYDCLSQRNTNRQLLVYYISMHKRDTQGLSRNYLQRIGLFVGS
jgi:hypothetical protein